MLIFITSLACSVSFEPVKRGGGIVKEMAVIPKRREWIYKVYTSVTCRWLLFKFIVVVLQKAPKVRSMCPILLEGTKAQLKIEINTWWPFFFFALLWTFKKNFTQYKKMYTVQKMLKKNRKFEVQTWSRRESASSYCKNNKVEKIKPLSHCWETLRYSSLVTLTFQLKLG